MTGKELISAAVRECERLRVSPTDANLLWIIRECKDLARLVSGAISRAEGMEKP